MSEASRISFRVSDLGFARPRTTAEVAAVIGACRAQGRQARVWGSGHSVEGAIGGEPRGDRAACGPGSLQPILLQHLRDVKIAPSIDGSSALVEAGAGCHLGYHLYDPARRSSWDNSLTHQLERAGFALGCLGGISHQTIAGFLSTGSAGGSLRYDAGAHVEALELVDGRGRVHHVRHDASDPQERDLFEAAGVSMGLLGVITRVWLRAIPSYDVIGREVTTARSQAAIDLLGRKGRAGLQDLFQRHDYSRVLWWPQPGFDRLQIWTGDRVPRRAERDLEPFEILGRFDTLLGSLLQTLVGNIGDLDRVLDELDRTDWFTHLERACGPIGRHDLLHRPDEGRRSYRGLTPGQAARLSRLARMLVGGMTRGRVSSALGRALARRMERWVGALTSLFVVDGEKHFVDRWHFALPMDNQLDDRLWPAAFSELWIPLESAAAAMEALQSVALTGGTARERYQLVGAFPIELYPGAPSRFWLSPGYRRPALRVNPCRFVQWRGEPDPRGFERILDAVRPFDARPHWGKHLPAPHASWLANLRRQLPRLEDFLRLRRALDPDGVFLTDYWRRNLGTDACASMPAPEVRR